MPDLQIVWQISGIILVIVLAYFVTYFIGVKSQGLSRRRGRTQNINLVDRFAISRDKSFCLVEIAGNVYVVAITNQTMTLLDKIDSAAFAEFEAERGGNDINASYAAAQRGQASFPTNNIVEFIAGKLKYGFGSQRNLNNRQADAVSDLIKDEDFKSTLGRASEREANPENDSEVPRS